MAHLLMVVKKIGLLPLNLFHNVGAIHELPLRQGVSKVTLPEHPALPGGNLRDYIGQNPQGIVGG